MRERLVVCSSIDVYALEFLFFRLSWVCSAVWMLLYKEQVIEFESKKKADTLT